MRQLVSLLGFLIRKFQSSEDYSTSNRRKLDMLMSATRGETLALTLTLILGEGVNYLTLRVQFYANEWN